MKRRKDKSNISTNPDHRVISWFVTNFKLTRHQQSHYKVNHIFIFAVVSHHSDRRGCLFLFILLPESFRLIINIVWYAHWIESFKWGKIYPRSSCGLVCIIIGLRPVVAYSDIHVQQHDLFTQWTGIRGKAITRYIFITVKHNLRVLHRNFSITSRNYYDIWL